MSCFSSSELFQATARKLPRESDLRLRRSQAHRERIKQPLLDPSVPNSRRVSTTFDARKPK